MIPRGAGTTKILPCLGRAGNKVDLSCWLMQWDYLLWTASAAHTFLDNSPASYFHYATKSTKSVIPTATGPIQRRPPNQLKRMPFCSKDHRYEPLLSIGMRPRRSLESFYIPAACSTMSRKVIAQLASWLPYCGTSNSDCRTGKTVQQQQQGNKGSQRMTAACLYCIQS